MYRHLLVPVDDTEVSICNVTAAVDFARSIGARVTFFHASPDYGATGEGALMHAMSPSTFADNADGHARAILAKAEASGRGAGVSCRGIHAISDAPSDAILKVADSEGCDLIFMASRGPASIGGIVLGSQTLKVLAGARIPVLVSQVASNARHRAMDSAMATIKDEHRSIAAVLHALRYIVEQGQAGDRSGDTRVVRAAIYYLRAFPESLHHPKEERYIFSRLRGRSPELDFTLDELELQHRDGAARLQVLADEFEAHEQRRSESFASIRQTFEGFAAALWHHMSTEEKVVLPAARQFLSDSDWAEIADAFGRNGDPRFDRDVDADFRNLFARIVKLAPIGG